MSAKVLAEGTFDSALVSLPGFSLGSLVVSLKQLALPVEVAEYH